MILLLSFTTSLILFAGDTANAFQLPKIKFVGLSNTKAENDLNVPQILVQKGPEDTEKLRLKLEKYCTDASSIDTYTTTFRWEPRLSESYEVANAIFDEVARVPRQGYNNGSEKQLRIVLSFPSMKRSADLDNLSQVLQSDKCKQMLGLDDVYAELYPVSPSPYLSVIFVSHDNVEKEGVHCQDVSIGEDDDTSADSARLSATKDWVNNFLGKYRLCPYTSSISRAAVGLSSVDVPVGGVHVVDTGTAINTIVDQDAITRATKLVASFWSEVNLLMKTSEKEWATSLVLCPEYDADFESFADICDTVVEPTVVATRSTDVIGRAWFHPLYNADAIGHSGVIGGHAVPHKMVYGFMKTLYSSSNANDVLVQYDDLAMANDKVRQTPHATINILRRSQLNAAAEYEKGLGEKRPKANSIYVRNVRRISDVMRSSNKE